MYISILDYSTGNNLVIHDEHDFVKGMQTEDVEDLLYALGFRHSQVSYMVTEEDPVSPMVTLDEITEENLDEVERICQKRLRGAESNENENEN